MSIKSEVIEGVKKELKISFPKLMKSSRSGVVVLFVSVGVGMVVNAGREKAFPVGRYSDNWHMEAFEDLEPEDEIVLRNQYNG